MGFKKTLPENISNPETLMGRNHTRWPTNPTRNVPDGLKTLKIGTLATTPVWKYPYQDYGNSKIGSISQYTE
jgi:hypothetical protein